MTNLKLVTPDQMRRIEYRSEALGVSKAALMQNAGLAIARRIRQLHAPLYGVPVLILAGPGNNGGDGIVAAQWLQRWQARPAIYICRDRPDPILDAARAAEVPTIAASADASLAQLAALLDRAHLVIDAALGIGRIRPIQSPLRDILAAAAAAKAARPGLRILAIDVPSGMNAHDGAADPACLPADLTLSMGYPKVGHYAYAAAPLIGALETTDIGLPPGVADDILLSVMTAAAARARLPLRPAASHKGSFGRTLAIAGSRNYIGAAHLSATAAARVGSGLATIATPASIQSPLAAKSPEPTYLPLPETAPGVISPDAAAAIFSEMAAYNGLLIGCGMGQAADTRQFIERILYAEQPLPPAVIDADALNALAQTPRWWERFPQPAILTPHPGEMARLAAKAVPDVQSDRIGIARESAALWNKIVVLKGAYTVVAYPDGVAEISPFANPGLASAGTGDVLAGSIAGLLSQSVSPRDAAALGVYLHALAGERVRRRLGDTGMLASDLLPELPRALKALRQAHPGTPG